MTEAFALFFLWTNSVAFLVGVSLTSAALARLGVGGTLAACALVSFGGFSAFVIWPVLMATVVPKALEDTLRFTLYRSAKEAIYTVAPREVVYRVKAHIEVFIYRIASGASGVLLLVLTGDRLMGLGPRAVAVAGLPLALAWAMATMYLGRTFARMKEEGEPLP
jgi:ATP/ADP translocase